jgi:hypothetical protein
MLDKILTLVKDAGKSTQPYLHVGNILANVDNITKSCGLEFLKDKDAMNEAIDHVIDVLKSHKSV